MSFLDKFKPKVTKKDFEDDYLDSLKAVEDYWHLESEDKCKAACEADNG